MTSRVLVVQNDRSGPIGPLGDWLVAAGVELDIREAFDQAALPDSLAAHAGLIVLGGAMGANDDQVAPWLPKVRRLLAGAVAAEVPVLGICLGAQLLAVALGGIVARNPDGPEIGAQLIAKRAAASTDPLLRELPITPDVIQWHYDAVTALPAGAQLLASSPTCEVQAFRVGRMAWGLQGHIETTAQLVREWAAKDSETLADWDVERLLARTDAVHDDIAEVWAPVAAAFAGVVRDPDSVPKARPIATHTAEPITDPAQIRAALAAEMQAARQPAPGTPTGLPWPTPNREQ